MGIEWVLSGYCVGIAILPSMGSLGTVLYGTWFGAPCLEVHTMVVQAPLYDSGTCFEAHGALDKVRCDMPAALCLVPQP